MGNHAYLYIAKMNAYTTMPLLVHVYHFFDIKVIFK